MGQFLAKRSSFRAQTLCHQTRLLTESTRADIYVLLPCFLNNADLLVEVDQLHQLHLQYPLSAHNLFDEDMLKKVKHIGPELKILYQTPEGDTIEKCENLCWNIQDVTLNGKW